MCVKEKGSGTCESENKSSLTNYKVVLHNRIYFCNHCPRIVPHPDTKIRNCCCSFRSNSIASLATFHAHWNSKERKGTSQSYRSSAHPPLSCSIQRHHTIYLFQRDIFVLFVKKVSSNCSEYANKTVSFQSRKMLNGGEMLTFKWSQACSLLIVRFSKKLILRFLACGIVTLIFTVEEVIILQQTFIEEMEILQPFILFQPFILTSEALLRQQHIFVIELTVYIMLLQ
ncbi:hypothetical protein ACET3Z_004846 [Daucus carota]